MLPAREGDCLWIEYGDPARPRRILIDGGRKSAYRELKKRFADLPRGQRRFELLILSHVDADHIEGLLELVTDPQLPVTFKDVWFNGERHLAKSESYGAFQGEAFSDEILERGWRWNAKFRRKSVVIPDSGILPVKPLADGMTLTLLSPTWDKLESLAPVWKRELKKARLARKKARPDTDGPLLESYGPLTVDEVEQAAASEFEPDSSQANGSSICVLAEFDGRKALLTGDAHADVVVQSLEKLCRKGAPLRLDACKLSHHGSHGTHSVELMRRIRCKRFLVSTDGSRHKHPHVEAIARTVKHGGGDIKLRFNYSTAYTEKWAVPVLQRRYGFEPVFGARGVLRTEL
jgi:beta-lactamase superfamily II metal-dependent hydrolase